MGIASSAAYAATPWYSRATCLRRRDPTLKAGMRKIDDGLTNSQRSYQRNREEVKRRARKWQTSPEGKAWRESQRAHFNAQSRAAAQERRDRISSIKMASGCIDCGFREFAEALHFDHLPGKDKLFDIGAAGLRRWETVEAEIAKCEVVCANCHARRTAERRTR